MSQNSAATDLQAPVSVMSLPDQIDHICALRAQGMTYREIEAATGLSHGTVHSRLTNKQAMRILEDATRYHIRSLPIAIARHNEIIYSDDDAVSLNAVKLRYQMTGLMPTHTPPITIQNLYIDQRTQVLSPGLVGLLSSGQSTVDEVIDIEGE